MLRTRLTLILLALIGVPLLVGAIPVARGFAAAAQRDMFLDRLQDATRLAGTAQQTVTDVDQAELHDEMARYSQVYGVTAGLIDDARTVRISAGDASALRLPAVRRSADAALHGHTPQATGVTWPWDDDPLIVAVPVLRGDDVVATVVTVSRTDALRALVLRQMLAFALAFAAVLAAAVLAVSRLADWALRPVLALDAATSEIAGGQLGFQVEAVTGPVELRRLADSFNNMATRMGRLLRAQSDFVADASHQLKTPLAALMLRLENLESGVDRTRAEELSEVFGEVERLRQILDALIRLAHATEADTVPTPTDLTVLVDRRLNAWQAQAAACGIELRHGPESVTKAGYAGTVVVTDAALLGSALDAIIDNALKFGRPPGTVEVSVLPKRAGVEVVVSDSGPGLPPEELSRIGDRFWRSSAHQEIEGTGLGLSFVRSVLEALGGEVRFAANAPTGLCVTLTLPRSRPPITAGFTPFPQAGPADSEPSEFPGPLMSCDEPQNELKPIGRLGGLL